MRLQHLSLLHCFETGKILSSFYGPHFERYSVDSIMYFNQMPRFIPMELIDEKPPLVPAMFCHHACDRSLSEPMIIERIYASLDPKEFQQKCHRISHTSQGNKNIWLHWWGNSIVDWLLTVEQVVQVRTSIVQKYIMQIQHGYKIYHALQPRSVDV